MDTRAPRVWVDDRHPIFRRGVIASLDHEGYRVSGESSDLQPLPRPDRLDILIFEGHSANLRKAAGFAKAAPDVHLVSLMRSGEEQHLVDAVELGVAAILLRQELSPAALMGSLRSVLSGSTTLPADALPRLLERAAHVSRSGMNGLTNRELDVLRLLAEGEDTRGIAGSLCYSDRTVKNIVHDLLMKLNCRNRAHAVALATRQGLI